MPETTPEQRKRLREILSVAPPAPWRFDGKLEPHETEIDLGWILIAAGPATVPDPDDVAAAEAIVESRNLAPGLLDDLQTAGHQIELLTQALQERQAGGHAALCASERREAPEGACDCGYQAAEQVLKVAGGS